ncbi:MAG: endo alpha-1,4 polygalactosaminidase [Polyangiaceae bacterium]
MHRPRSIVLALRAVIIIGATFFAACSSTSASDDAAGPGSVAAGCDASCSATGDAAAAGDGDVSAHDGGGGGDSGSTASITLPPNGKVSWDWQIGADTEASVGVPAGVKLLDVDGFATSAAKVASLKSAGVYAVCYINAGSYQPGLPDSAEYPESLKIQADPDWPGEYFLDVTDVFKPGSVLASILEARFKMCKDKGFDALEPDNLQNDENVTSGTKKITLQDQLDFNGWVADAAHAAGLAVFQKNGPDKVLLKAQVGWPWWVWLARIFRCAAQNSRLPVARRSASWCGPRVTSRANGLGKPGVSPSDVAQEKWPNLSPPICFTELPRRRR